MDPLLYFDVPVLDSLLTEQRNPASEKLDTAATSELLRIINREDRKVAAAVELEIPRIAEAVDAIVERFQAGGRLFYAGAGTSGRLGVLDAAECPPTFGVPPDRVQAVIAGGPGAVLQASEGSEDRTDTAEADLRAKGLAKNDSLIAISASGRTPYALAAAVYGQSLGAFTVGLSCNPQSELASQVDVAISPSRRSRGDHWFDPHEGRDGAKAGAEHDFDSRHGSHGVRTRQLDGERPAQQRKAA